MSKRTGSTLDTQAFDKYGLINYWSNNNSSKWNQCNASSHSARFRLPNQPLSCWKSSLCNHIYWILKGLFQVTGFII